MANNVSISRPPDVGTILWERNLLDRTAQRTIVQASVIGSAASCLPLYNQADVIVEQETVYFNILVYRLLNRPIRRDNQ